MNKNKKSFIIIIIIIIFNNFWNVFCILLKFKQTKSPEGLLPLQYISCSVRAYKQWSHYVDFLWKDESIYEWHIGLIWKHQI